MRRIRIQGHGIHIRNHYRRGGKVWRLRVGDGAWDDFLRKLSAARKDGKVAEYVRCRLLGESLVTVTTEMDGAEKVAGGVGAALAHLREDVGRAVQPGPGKRAVSSSQGWALESLRPEPANVLVAKHHRTPTEVARTAAELGLRCLHTRVHFKSISCRTDFGVLTDEEEQRLITALGAVRESARRGWSVSRALRKFDAGFDVPRREAG
jgi:hypothetical protein